MNKDYSKTDQHLLPEVRPFHNDGSYDIYPSFKLNDNQISEGFESLAEVILKQRIVIFDGYVGVFYDKFYKKLDECLKNRGLKASWKYTSDYLKRPDTIEAMVSPFTGSDDPLFGKRTTLNLDDFFDLPRLIELSPDPESDINLIIGPGASLAGWDGLHVYIDIPKNEIQFRSRAGSITNLGASFPLDPKEMYKRFYFVDWIVLNKHKRDILSEVDLFVDAM